MKEVVKTMSASQKDYDYCDDQPHVLFIMHFYNKVNQLKSTCTVTKLTACIKFLLKKKQHRPVNSDSTILIYNEAGSQILWVTV